MWEFVLYDTFTGNIINDKDHFYCVIIMRIFKLLNDYVSSYIYIYK